MPFHVEIRQAIQRAWAFNLSAEKLRRTVVDPWRRGDRFELGDREWDPRDATLRILEGPELAPPELAHGQGWHHAERSAREVTAATLTEAQTRAVSVAVLAETPAGLSAVAPLVEQLEARSVEWAAARARILAAATLAGGGGARVEEVVVAVLVVERHEPSASWLFEAGLALGALGGRVIVAQLGDQPPPIPLRDLGPIRLDPDQPGSLQALAERLRAACAPR
jgi:hypothetical protein